MEMKKTLPRCAPEEQGVPSQAVLGFLEFIQKQTLRVHSYMIVKNGHVISEAWWKPFAPNLPHMLFSLSKSFTSIAVGFAVQERLVSVDDCVCQYFPEHLAALEGQYDERFKRMKLRHLLTMSTGQAREAAFGENSIYNFIKTPLAHEPGSRFMYNTPATYMLSAVVQKVTGQRLSQYLTPRLFEPLGIEDPIWDRCTMGIDMGGIGLNLRTEDIAKFGQFLLQKGVWNGERLLDAAWIEAASAKQADSSRFSTDPDWIQGYGYQFWRCRHNAFRGDGMFGQFCVIMPDQNAVVAITGSLDMQKMLDGVWELLPALSGAPRNVRLATRTSALKRKIAGLSHITDEDAQKRDRTLEKSVSRRVYEIDRNWLGVHRMTVNFYDDDCQITLLGKNGAVKETFMAGMGTWKRTTTNAPFGAAYAKAVWAGDSFLRVDILFPETPFVAAYTFRFDGNNVWATRDTYRRFALSGRS